MQFLDLNWGPVDAQADSTERPKARSMIVTQRQDPVSLPWTTRRLGAWGNPMRGTRRRKSVEAGKLCVGTTGWSYGGWDKVFYPEKVKTTYERLGFYAQSFNAVEVNYSF